MRVFRKLKMSSMNPIKTGINSGRVISPCFISGNRPDTVKRQVHNLIWINCIDEKERKKTTHIKSRISSFSNCLDQVSHTKEEINPLIRG
jgi:hypothetical protein